MNHHHLPFLIMIKHDYSLSATINHQPLSITIIARHVLLIHHIDQQQILIIISNCQQPPTAVKNQPAIIRSESSSALY